MKGELIGKLIGLRIRIVDSRNKNEVGIEGKVVDETKNMVKIKRGKKMKMLLKKNIIFEVMG